MRLFAVNSLLNANLFHSTGNHHTRPLKYTTNSTHNHLHCKSQCSCEVDKHYDSNPTCSLRSNRKGKGHFRKNLLLTTRYSSLIKQRFLLPLTQLHKTSQQTVVSRAIVAIILLRTPFAFRRHVTGVLLINERTRLRWRWTRRRATGRRAISRRATRGWATCRRPVYVVTRVITRVTGKIAAAVVLLALLVTIHIAWQLFSYNESSNHHPRRWACLQQYQTRRTAISNIVSLASLFVNTAIRYRLTSKVTVSTARKRFIYSYHWNINSSKLNHLPNYKPLPRHFCA